MRALIDFVTTDYGLLSAAVIAFTVGMAGYYIRFVIRHVREEEAQQRAHAPQTAHSH